MGSEREELERRALTHEASSKDGADVQREHAIRIDPLLLPQFLDLPPDARNERRLRPAEEGEGRVERRLNGQGKLGHGVGALRGLDREHRSALRKPGPVAPRPALPQEPLDRMARFGSAPRDLLPREVLENVGDPLRVSPGSNAHSGIISINT